MCAASRALSSVATLGVGCLLTAMAWAEAPVISTPPAPPPPAASAPPAPAPPSTPPSSSAPPFTPAPEPPFTEASPAPPAPVGPAAATAPAAAPSAAAPPAYVAPAYAAPPPTFDTRSPASVSPPVAAIATRPAESAKPTASDDPRWNDAHLDRVVLLPTGETHPSGTTYLSSYEIVGLQAGHAFTDRMQLTLSFVPPLTKDPIVPLDLTLKGVLLRSRRVRVAAMSSASGLIGFESGAVAVGRVGGVTQLCFDDRCESSISMGATMALVGTLILADGVGAIVRVNHAVKLLFEIQSVLPIGRDGGEFHALGGAVGIRISGKRLGLDIAFEGPLDRQTKPQAIPVIVGTYRFLP